MILSTYEVIFAKTTNYSFVDYKKIASRIRYNNIMKNIIDSFNFGNPIILDVSTHLHIYSLTKNIYLNDPYLYILLWKDNIIDYHPFIQSIYDKHYDIIIFPRTFVSLESENYTEPDNKIVLAITNGYELKNSFLSYCFYVRN